MTEEGRVAPAEKPIAGDGRMLVVLSGSTTDKIQYVLSHKKLTTTRQWYPEEMERFVFRRLVEGEPVTDIDLTHAFRGRERGISKSLLKELHRRYPHLTELQLIRGVWVLSARAEP